MTWFDVSAIVNSKVTNSCKDYCLQVLWHPYKRLRGAIRTAAIMPTITQRSPDQVFSGILIL